MNKILIFSGPIKSGKTTQLQKFLTNKNCDGIISPKIDGKRFLQRIKTGEKKLLDSENGNGIQIGKHIFDEKTFAWSRGQLLQILNSDIDYIIVDEIGHLELSGRGFEPMFSHIFERCRNNKEIKLVIVVRDTLVDDVIKNYQIDQNNIEIKNPVQN